MEGGAGEREGGMEVLGLASSQGPPKRLFFSFVVAVVVCFIFVLLDLWPRIDTQ